MFWVPDNFAHVGVSIPARRLAYLVGFGIQRAPNFVPYNTGHGGSVRETTGIGGPGVREAE